MEQLGDEGVDDFENQAISLDEEQPVFEDLYLRLQRPELRLCLCLERVGQ